MTAKKFETDVTDRDIVRLMWRESLRYKSLLYWSTLNIVGAVGTSILVPYYISRIFANLIGHADKAWAYFPALIIAAGIGFLGNRFGFTKLMEFQAKLQADLQTKCLEILMRRSVGFHNDRISGKLVSDAIDYPNAFGNLLVTVVVNLLPFFVIVLSGILIVGWHSWQLGLALATVVGVTVWLVWVDSRRRAELRNKRLQANKKVTGHLSDVIVNIQTVKTFAREDFELTGHKQLNTKLMNLRLHDWIQTGVRGSNRMAALLAMQVLFVAYVVHLVQKDPAILSIGIFAFSYTITLTNRLFDLSTMIRVTDENLLNAAPMTEIFMQTAEIKDAPHAQPIKTEKGVIEFEHVNFQYPDSKGQDNVFEDLSLRIASGEKVGLIGPSGGGKSTFTRLLLRFEDITSGSIQIDDQAIDKVTQSSLRQAISYVPQEPLLFHRTIRENIAYGKADANDEIIIAAAKKAYAHDFIQSLPKGYDTIVGERGVKLSGGQRQRVAIARAILKDAPILVLDEATSALDSESEKYIQEALRELMHDRTTIVIAHRLSTIQTMDRIVVLDEGKIIEQGSHKELLKEDGMYARLWQHQSGGFIEE